MGDLLEMIREGGPLMVPIVGVSIGMWALILHKAMELRSMDRRGLGDLVLKRTELIGFRRRGIAVALKALEQEIAKGLPLLRSLISIAPLLGLLGTVMGMDKVFWVIAYHGTGSPKALAQGISEALITTVSGLMVAIPGLFFYGLLSRRAREIRAIAEEMSYSVLSPREGR